MKKAILKSSISLFLLFGINNLFAQVPFTSYLCAMDTIFSGKSAIAKQKLTKDNFFGSSFSKNTTNLPSGEIKGLAINRSGNFNYFTGGSELKSFKDGQLFTTHKIDSAGVVISKIGKSIAKFDIGTKSSSTLSYVPFAANVNPQPTTLSSIYLGTTNYQTTNNRGNIFVVEDFYVNNREIKKLNRDTFDSNNNFGGYTAYPDDNTDYSLILNSLNSAEYTGWFLELDRTNNNFQYRRFDLGRAPRKCAIVQSERTQTPASLSRVNQTYQVLGGNGFNILVRTQLNNNVQEFSVYSEEENTLGEHWSLLNPINSGKIQPLTKEMLLDLFKAVVTHPTLEFTYFLNVTDIKVNDVTGSIILVTPGGIENIDDFKANFGIQTTPVILTFLASSQSGSNYNDKLGHILEINASNFVVTDFKGGVASKGGNGRFFSNPYAISFYNVGYFNSNSDPINTSYAIVSERVLDNSLNQNPSYKKNQVDFQNEVYLVNLDEVLQSSNTIDFSTKSFELFQVLENNSYLIQSNYTESYLPFISVTKNLNGSVDSLNLVRGFADFYIKPDSCISSVSINEIATVASKEVIIYPNPLDCASGNCDLSINTTDDVTVFNVHGQKVATFNNTNKLNLSNLNNGIFIVKGAKGWSKILIKN